MTGFYMKYNIRLKWVKHRLVTFKLVNSRLVSQLTFSCSKSTIEKLEKKCNMFNVSNKNTRATSLTT